MRLIGSLEDAAKAEAFSRFLTKEKIAHNIQPHEEGGKLLFWVWIVEEDDIEAGMKALESFHASPHTFSSETSPTAPPPTWRIRPPSADGMKRSLFSLTGFFIVLCSLLFGYSAIQVIQIANTKGTIAAQLTLAPLQRATLLDETAPIIAMAEIVEEGDFGDAKTFDEIPAPLKKKIQAAQALPSWKGAYFGLMASLFGQKLEQGPLFEKIQKGEIWRLVTPCFMHGGIIHILFNMLWLWVLGTVIEKRLQIAKSLLLFLSIGIISNLAQYLMAGPVFFGFSGIICGMVGFIWVRQRRFPWEGYELSRSTITIIFFYIGGLFALQVILFFLQLFNITTFDLPIANTGHIVGGLTGIFFGRLPFFAPRKR